MELALPPSALMGTGNTQRTLAMRNQRTHELRIYRHKAAAATILKDTPHAH